MTNIADSQLKSFTEPVRDELLRFNDFFRKQLKSNVALLDIVVRYVLRSRGKQLRPALVFLSAGACGTIDERTYVGAAMVELLHTATLVHDDVVDDANERRGLASINAVWKNKVAVLVGDFFLSRGLLIAVDNDEFDFLRVTSRAVKRMSEGELLQIQKSKQRHTDEQTYFRIIADKTASLISTCCEIGAVSAHSDERRHQALRQYGELIGLAFQIRDDVLDYTSRTSILGKPSGNDIREGKLTLPLIYACSHSNNGEAKKIVSMVKAKNASTKNVEYIVDYVTANGGIEYAATTASRLSTEAVSQLSALNDSDYKLALVSLARYVVEREK